MKSSIFSLAFIVSLVAAQAEELPRCAVPCVTRYTTGNAIAGCQNGNIECICKNEEFLDGIACCLIDECDEAGQAAAIRFASQICATAGVQVPNQVVCRNNSASESATEAATGSSTGSATEAASATGSQTSAASAESASTVPTSSTEPNAAAGLDSGILGAVAAVLLAL